MYDSETLRVKKRNSSLLHLVIPYYFIRSDFSISLTAFVRQCVLTLIYAIASVLRINLKMCLYILFICSFTFNFGTSVIPQSCSQLVAMHLEQKKKTKKTNKSESEISACRKGAQKKGQKRKNCPEQNQQRGGREEVRSPLICLICFSASRPNEG